MLLVAGCESSPRRYPIQGTITYQNAPLDEGTITFSPVDNAKAPTGVASIAEGKYALPADKGLVPGSYRVSIVVPTVKGSKPAADEPPGAPRRNKELVTEDRKIEVTPAGPHEFNFDLK